MRGIEYCNIVNITLQSILRYFAHFARFVYYYIGMVSEYTQRNIGRRTFRWKHFFFGSRNGILFDCRK